MSLRNAGLLIFLILVFDQAVKIYVKTNFVLGEEVSVFSWWKILFIENEGMAWGTEIPSFLGGKIALTVFRLVAVAAIGYWLYDSVQKSYSPYLIVAISLIAAGAFGNIIDSVFYGVIFSDSHNHLATLFPARHYGTLLHGKVVDMLYFPIIDSAWPDWMPVVGGKSFRFFNAIFNIADASISVGVGILIVFNKKAFHRNA